MWVVVLINGKAKEVNTDSSTWETLKELGVTPDDVIYTHEPQDSGLPQEMVCAQAWALGYNAKQPAFIAPQAKLGSATHPIRPLNPQACVVCEDSPRRPGMKTCSEECEMRLNAHRAKCPECGGFMSARQLGKTCGSSRCEAQNAKKEIQKAQSKG